MSGPGWTPNFNKWRPMTMGRGARRSTASRWALVNSHSPAGNPSNCFGGRPAWSARATRTSRSMRRTCFANRRTALSEALAS